KTISELASVSYVRQKEPLGLGHAILCARALVGDEPFGVFLGDDIITSRTPCMRQLLDVFQRHGGPVLAVMRMPREEIGRYGVIAPRGLGGNVYEVQDLVEKPDPKDAPSDLAIVGRYVLTPDIFPILADTPPDSRGEIQLTNGLRVLRGRRVIYAVEFEGKRHDIGEKLGFLKATVEFALARPDLADSFGSYLRTLDFYHPIERCSALSRPASVRKIPCRIWLCATLADARSIDFGSCFWDNRAHSGRL